MIIALKKKSKEILKNNINNLKRISDILPSKGTEESVNEDSSKLSRDNKSLNDDKNESSSSDTSDFLAKDENKENIFTKNEIISNF